MEPKYPKVQVSLSGADGNAFAILGRTNDAMKDAGVPDDDRQAYFEEAISGNYDHLLQTTMKWVEVS